MRATQSRTLFRITQDLSATLSADPQFSSHVQSFLLDKIPGAHAYPEVLSNAIARAFPDYDFSGLQEHHFRPIESPQAAYQELGWAMSSRFQNGDSAWARIYQNIETEISPALCDIFAYEPDCTDAFVASGAVWSACYLFLNAKDKKVFLFHLRDGGRDFDPDGSDEEDEDLEIRYGYSVF
jgi:hypothetical protein